jgi:hypothetical protein
MKASHLQLKAFNFLKMSLKSLKICQNASGNWKKPQFLFKWFKKAADFLKASNHFKKGSNLLKMFLKSLAILKKPHH